MLHVVPMHVNTTFIPSSHSSDYSCKNFWFHSNCLTSILYSLLLTTDSLISFEYTKVIRCLHIQKSRGLKSGDHADHLTGPSCSIHCPTRVWFSCCLTVQKKMRCAPSCKLACVVDEEAHLPRVLVNHWTKTDSTMHLVLTAVLRCPFSLKSYGIEILVSSHM